MKRFSISVLMVVLMVCFVASSYGQFVEPTEHHKVFQKDVGTWNAKMKIWAPSIDEPQVAEGTETGRMLGGFWLISNFKGELAPGLEYHGHGVFGYDEEKQKYVGTWTDSMSSTMSTMEGTYDADSKTMTMETLGKDPAGNVMKGKNVTVMKDENTRVFTMYIETEGEWMKQMEITYTKEK